MSKIIKEIYKATGIVATTTHLVKVKKVIKPTYIPEAYIKLTEQKNSPFKKLDLKYNNQPLFINALDGKLGATISLFIKYSNFAFSDDETLIGLERFRVSEIYNSLSINDSKISRPRIDQILNGKDVTIITEQDKLIRNYNDALNFIETTDDINEATLFALYVILTRNMDSKNGKIDGYPYRQKDIKTDGDVKIGLQPEDLKKSMDTIFEMINSKKQMDRKKIITNAFSIHYLFEQLQPYYFMNSHMCRLLTLWYAKKMDSLRYFTNISEAINIYKKDQYYGAFKSSRFKGFRFDITYFIQSVLTALAAQRIAQVIISYLENGIKDKYKVKFNDIQRDMITGILAKDQGWYKIDGFYMGYENTPSGELTNAISQLVEWDIFDVTFTTPREFKFKKYEILDAIINLANSSGDL